MRISTKTVFDHSASQLNAQQAGFLKVGEQVASGKRVVNPSDDPLAMSKALGIKQSTALNEQFKGARTSARNALSQEESVLNSISTAITSAKSLLVQASTDTLSDADRTSIASDLKGILETIIGQANAADGNGRYLFGGFQDNAPPFQADASGNITYVGDSGVLKQQIDSARQMPTNDTGMDVFMSVFNSAGLVARAGASNTGSVQFEQPLPVDKTDPNFGQNVDIAFSDVAGTMYYSVNGGTPQAYVDGGKITVNGESIVLKGTPADGDTVQIRSGNNGNSDLFKSIKDAITALETPVNTAADKAALKNTMISVGAELSSNLDKVLTVRASVGSRLNELDTVDAVGDNRALNYKQTYSDLIDLDYTSALSEYSLRQTAIQAAQKAFVDTQSLSLFNFMK
ncbi:flagellar hook-associated protein FlgL [Pseudomonas aeruginosa]